MKTVFQTNDVGTMTVVKSILESSGISCVLLDEYTQLVKPSALQFSGGGRLAVADEREEEAKAIIEDYLKTVKENSSFTKETVKSNLKCPECGSKEFVPTLWSILFGGNKYKCAACGNKFKYKL
ncbi:MAG: DUF2007 domain-containing protein [Candidatus Firestonebacteria bacterium]